MSNCEACGLVWSPSHRCYEADCQPKPSEGTVSDELLGRLFVAMCASCGCLTKTPDPKYHKLDCLFRILNDAHDRLVSNLATIERQAGEIETLHARNQSRELRIAELEADLAAARLNEFDLVAHIERQRAFSESTFGPGMRTEGVSDHIRKELLEIAKDPTDLFEWVDVILLAIDGAWRSGHSSKAICEAINAKQTKNEGRKWPDWRTVPAGKAIEHDRSQDAAIAAGDGK